MAFSNLKSVNMGATAVGTGINTDERYKRICVKHLCDITQIELTSARDLIDGTRNVDPFVFAHASLKTLCVSCGNRSAGKAAGKQHYAGKGKSRHSRGMQSGLLSGIR